MNKIGIHFGYFNENWDTDFVKQIEQVKKLGFDILEVAPAPLLARNKSQRDEIARAAKDNEIEITFSVGLGREYDISSENSSVRQNGIRFVKDSFNIMKEMGANMFSGVDTGAWNKTYDFGCKNKRKDLEYSIGSVREIMKQAESDGITFAVEVVNRYESALINTAEEAVAYVDEVGSPNCKILLDTYHMNIEEDSFGDAIRLVGTGRLGHFHVGEANRRPPRADGRMPWDEITSALKEIHYTGRIVMEPFIKTGGEVGRDIKIWRDISRGASLAEREQMVADSVKMLREKMNG